MCFYIAQKKEKTMYMLTPKNTTINTIDFFTWKIFCNKNVKKLCHGSDAQDIPHIIKEFLWSTNVTIKDKKIFMNSIIDTKLICKYYNNDENNTEKQCDVYSLYKKTGAIDITLYDELTTIEGWYRQNMKMISVTTDTLKKNEMLKQYW